LGSIIGVPLLLLALLLGIIAIFKSPKGQARASIIISGLTLGFISYLIIILSQVFVQPMINFGIRVQDEVNSNTTMEAIFKQP
jgi:hypothetical protein